MEGRNALESHSLIMSTWSPFNVNIVASYYNFSNNSHKATHMVIFDTNLGIEVTVNGAIMGPDPICNSMAEGVRPLCSSLTLFGFCGSMGQVRSWPRRARVGARQAERSAGGGRSLKRKSRHSGKFWFSDPMVRPDPVFGLYYKYENEGAVLDLYGTS